MSTALAGANPYLPQGQVTAAAPAPRLETTPAPEESRPGPGGRGGGNGYTPPAPQAPPAYDGYIRGPNGEMIRDPRFNFGAYTPKWIGDRMAQWGPDSGVDMNKWLGMVSEALRYYQ